MKILVIGAGALGGYYGGRLAHRGSDVSFLVRARRAEQLQRTGLVLVGRDGDLVVSPKILRAHEVSEVFDVVLVGVKSYALSQAIDEFAPAVGPATMILPILNGLKHLDELKARFGDGPVLGGRANISAGLDAEGRVVQFMPNDQLILGEIGGGSSARTDALAALLKDAGIDGRASDTVMHDMWEKFVQLSTLAGITCLMRASIGDILEVPGGRDAIFQLFEECCAVATASGYAPRPAFIEFDHALFSAKGSPLKASMLRDVERGSVTEAEHILGDMASRARSLQIKTPLLDLARAHLAAYEIGRARSVAG